MNKRTPVRPGWQNVFNGLAASLQMQGTSSRPPTGPLHKPLLQVRLHREAAMNGRQQLVSDHQLVSGGTGAPRTSDKREVLLIGMRA